ncbi:hypothetical protein K461DRAFT_309491 [Myriangium duriaei CBS 260.36]|uniref:Uncharacterized protein n=1 Tax=Myriangium duriaei CBS 260.36 TaxID=1168546 RepID=A0A9P4J964_9PEZI|nr:hypothetical protein K461DRAFT_309491 [Myriangium duriaei CBS 260.36]
MDKKRLRAAPPFLYRRPETADTSNFWFLSQEDYNELTKQLPGHRGGARNPGQKRAQSKLRRYEIAGLIMETNKGKDAIVPCDACLRRGTSCRVLRDNNTDKACALCKCFFKPGCRAGVVVNGALDSGSVGRPPMPLTSASSTPRTPEQNGLGITPDPIDNSSIIEDNSTAVIRQYSERLHWMMGETIFSRLHTFEAFGYQVNTNITGRQIPTQPRVTTDAGKITMADAKPTHHTHPLGDGRLQAAMSVMAWWNCNQSTSLLLSSMRVVCALATSAATWNSWLGLPKRVLSLNRASIITLSQPIHDNLDISARKLASMTLSTKATASLCDNT